MALLYLNTSMTKISKHVNHDFSLVVQWFRSNKISLNADKTEIIYLDLSGNKLPNISIFE